MNRLTVPQACGHRLVAPHIETPEREFRVSWFAPLYVNALTFKAGRRWARVLAQTSAGALRVAQYHHSRGSNFRIDEGRQHDASCPKLRAW